MRRGNGIIAIEPGATIKEVLEDRKMEQRELAALMDISENQLEMLLCGESQLTVAIAESLENALGIPSQFWLNLESIYREKLAKIAESA